MNQLEEIIKEARIVLEFKYTGNVVKDFTDDHPLAISFVASQVASREVDDRDKERDLAKYLLKKFAKIYKANSSFGKSVLFGRGNKGRDKLYDFMVHWAAAYNKAKGKPNDYSKVMK